MTQLFHYHNLLPVAVIKIMIKSNIVKKRLICLGYS